MVQPPRSRAPISDQTRRAARPHRDIAAMLGLFACAITGCSSSDNGVCSCPGPPREATIDLGCVRFESTSVKTTGPCTVCPSHLDTGSLPPGNYCEVLPGRTSIVLMASGAGKCHVDVTFEGGTTSSIDIDFMSEWIACGSDPHGCGEGFVPSRLDASVGLFSLRGPSCDAGLPRDD